MLIIRKLNFAHAVIGLTGLICLWTWWPETAWSEVACPDDFSKLESSETLFGDAGAEVAALEIDEDDMRRLTKVSASSLWEASGDYHLPEEISAAYNRAVLMIVFGLKREAEARMRCILQHEQMQRGTHNETYPGLLVTLAAIVQIQGRYSAAQKILQQSLAILDDVLGPEYILKVKPLTLLGLGFHAQGNKTAALIYYQDALRIIEKTMGPNQIDAAPWQALIREASEH